MTDVRCILTNVLTTDNEIGTNGNQAILLSHAAREERGEGRRLLSDHRGPVAPLRGHRSVSRVRHVGVVSTVGLPLFASAGHSPPELRLA